jgi:lysophospholipase L1-like esterase
MAAERGRASWWLAAGVIGILVVSGALFLGSGGPLSERAGAAAQSSAPAVGAERPTVAFVGDSWTVGVGATGMRGYAVLTGERLAWEYHVLGVGGSGYTLPGRGSTFDQRVDRAVDTEADVIVVQGSLNERGGVPSALAPAARTTLTHLRAQASPGTEILVVGASYTPGTSRATIDRINEDIAEAAEAAELSFVNPARENWTDPADPTIWNDPDHPNDAGHQLIADRLTPLLRAALER